VFDGDTFKPHTLEKSEVKELKQQLADYPEVKEAYLVEKVVTYFPEQRFLVLGIVRKRGWIESEDADRQLIHLLATNLQFPTQAYIISFSGSGTGKLKKKICQIDRSLLFRR
jgi:predicted translin family RNA/ssDNA-binding protein